MRAQARVAITRQWIRARVLCDGPKKLHAAAASAWG